MTSRKITLISIDHVITFNKEIVAHESQKHLVLNHGNIDGAVSASFYPGNYPFRYGGVAKIAGALCFFLSKAHGFFDGNKRTAGIAAVTFMGLNGYDLVYPFSTKTGHNEFAHVIEELVNNKLTKDEVMKWFESHKKRAN